MPIPLLVPGNKPVSLSLRQISFITIHPSFVESYKEFGVFAAATKLGIGIDAINLRDYAVDKHGSVDGRVYGGGDGMILRPEPLANALTSLQGPGTLVCYPSPHGRRWCQQEAENFLTFDCRHLVFICGRFGGIDQRFLDKYVDLEFSLGDFVISGGELSSLTIADSLLRLVPGVLGHRDSALRDSFAKGQNGLLESPQYTRPPEFEGSKVPEVLMGGNHEAIKTWQSQQSRLITQQRRPDLFKNSAHLSSIQALDDKRF